MKKLNKELVVALLCGLFVILGITGYFSYDDFLNPVIKQITHGYSTNKVENPSVSNKLKSVVSKIETYVDKEIGFKTNFVEFNAKVQLLTGKRVFDVGSSTVVRLNNGYLTYQYDEISDKSITKNADAIKELDIYLDKRDIPLVFCLAPYKNSKYDYQLPNGLKDTMNDAADRFVSLIDGYGVAYIDFREEIHNEGFEHYSCFYVTDHHWKAETGFWAFTKIANHLKENCGFEFDDYITDLENYNVKKYNKWFLGSQGKKVGKYVAGIDDINIITPKFETDYLTEQPLKKKKASGSFDKALMNMSFVEKKDYYVLNPYATYTGGDFAYQIITNTKAVNDKKILVVRDSVACAVTPFLSLCAKELHILDLRDSLTGSKTKPLYDYIDGITPDAVLFLYSPTRFREAEVFDFHK